MDGETTGAWASEHVQTQTVHLPAHKSSGTCCSALSTLLVSRSLHGRKTQ